MCKPNSMLVALCFLLGLLAGAEGRVVEMSHRHGSDGRSVQRNAAAARSSGLGGPVAGVLRAVENRRRMLFEPPRTVRRHDVNDSEAADVCLSFAAGACTCM